MVSELLTAEFWLRWPGPLSRIPGHLRPDIKERCRNGARGIMAAGTVILEANPARKAVILTNDSTAVIYIAIGANAVINTGIRLNAGGGAITIDNALFTREIITGVVAAGGPFNVCWVEID